MVEVAAAAAGGGTRINGLERKSERGKPWDMAKA